MPPPFKLHVHLAPARLQVEKRKFLKNLQDKKASLTVKKERGYSVRVKHAYTGRDSRELSLTKGETLLVHGQLDKDWLKVETNGELKLVPTAFVEELDVADIQVTLQQAQDELEKERLKVRQADAVLALAKAQISAYQHPRRPAVALFRPPAGPAFICLM